MFSSIAIVLPFLTALALRSPSGRESTRGLCVGATGLSLFCILMDSGMDPLSRLAMSLYSILVIAVIGAAPGRDCAAKDHREIMLCTSGTLMAYASDNLLLFLLGWTLSAVPLWDWHNVRKWTPTSTPAILAVGTAALAAAIGIMAWSASNAAVGNPFSIETLQGLRVIDNYWVYGLLAVAFLARKGMIPFRSWLVAECERGNLIKTSLFLNGPLGAFVVARLAFPLAPHTQQAALGPLSILALLFAGYASLAALIEPLPRRLLGLLSISHVSFVLVGLESGSEVGVTGAVIYLAVLGLSTTLLFVVIRALEARLNESLSLEVFHGLGARVPRLAAFFLVGALALVGLPGTLGFVAEDLLFHGTMESHPALGFIMPVATAFNAITMFRMFSRLFFGRLTRFVPSIPDALSRERWTLTACVLLLVLLGLRPDVVFRAAIATAEIAQPASLGAISSPSLATSCTAAQPASVSRICLDLP
jgi:NADH-quinone oxidoreductase subunit M